MRKLNEPRTNKALEIPVRGPVPGGKPEMRTGAGRGADTCTCPQRTPRSKNPVEVPDAWMADIEEIRDLLSEVCPWRLETWLALLRKGSSLELEIRVWKFVAKAYGAVLKRYDFNLQERCEVFCLLLGATVFGTDEEVLDYMTYRRIDRRLSAEILLMSREGNPTRARDCGSSVEEGGGQVCDRMPAEAPIDRTPPGRCRETRHHRRSRI